MNTPLRVLIVEDSEPDSLLLLRELRQGGYEPQSQRVDSAAALTTALAAQEWDVVISDYRMPQFTGLDALKLVQACGRDLPFILVSGSLGDEQAVAVMKAGAHDFLLKDRLAGLAPAVRRGLGDATARRLRVRAGLALRHVNARLEQRVRERTAQLEIAVKELDAFSHSVAHDLRAPLRAMDWLTGLLVKQQAGRLDDNGLRMLGAIRDETHRMGQLIDDLLAFARLGRQPVESAPIDMQALAREVFDELAALDPGRKLRLDLHPLPPALGTPAMIRQVWVNLIGNAIKFTKERETGEIEIGVREGEDGVPVYYVKDNGAGYDMRHAEKLFGVFQRLHSQQEFPGTGVGLSLVQRIVRRHGGRVRAEGEVEKGATFYFTLPNR